MRETFQGSDVTVGLKSVPQEALFVFSTSGSNIYPQRQHTFSWSQRRYQRALKYRIHVRQFWGTKYDYQIFMKQASAAATQNYVIMFLSSIKKTFKISFMLCHTLKRKNKKLNVTEDEMVLLTPFFTITKVIDHKNLRSWLVPIPHYFLLLRWKSILS